MTENTSNPHQQSWYDKLRAAMGLYPYFLRTIRLIWEASRWLTVTWSLLLLVQGLLPVAIVSLSKRLVDSLAAGLSEGGGWTGFQPTLLLAGLLGCLLLVGEVLRGANDWVRVAQSELIQDHLTNLVHDKAISVDLAYFESSDYHDRFYRATNEASSRTLALLESIGSLFQNSLTLIGMLAVLLPYGWWLPAVLLISTLPAFFVVIKYNRQYHRWWERTTQDRRWASYHALMLTHSQAAAELRLFNLGAFFQSSYRSIRERLRGERLRLIRVQNLVHIGAATFALLISGGAMLWLVWRTIQGAYTLGDLALIYQALNQGQNLMRSLLSNLGQIYTSSLFLNNLFEFLDLQPNVIDPAQPYPAPVKITHGIHFRDITFYYPGSNRPAVQECDLFIPARQVTAIVGENGAGKSTLVKLLCRFYDPQEGGIELDGIDLRDLTVSELWRQITVMFQHPLPYHSTAGQNIALGNLAMKEDLSGIKAAAQHAGAHELINHLPKGYDTLLGKWFTDGVELSSGEWQRIALARAYYRQAPILILDEPTSFMDSWTEADWFSHLRGLVDGRTALIITHRFTIAMRADIIHVMHLGRIVESGSHAELLSQGGRYAEAWDAQMRVSLQT